MKQTTERLLTGLLDVYFIKSRGAISQLQHNNQTEQDWQEIFHWAEYNNKNERIFDFKNKRDIHLNRQTMTYFRFFVR